MSTTSLKGLADDLLDAIRGASSGRSAKLVYGGRARALSQTMIAIAAGRGLDGHEALARRSGRPRGRVRLLSGQHSLEGVTRDFMVIPPATHSVLAVEDSVILPAVAKRR